MYTLFASPDLLCLVVWCRHTKLSPTFGADALSCHQRLATAQRTIHS